MNTRSNPIAAQNLALAAPQAEQSALRPAASHTLPVVHPAYHHSYAALPKGRRLP